jgi:hypothetical protein
VTRLVKILLFGQKFLALGDFFQGKNCPMIWAKFMLNKIGWGIVWAIFVVIWAILSQKHLVTLTFNKIRPWLKEF